jgi:hypothetical protein
VVTYDGAVAHLDDTMGPVRDLGRVGHCHDRHPLLSEPVEQVEESGGVDGVEAAGRLVGEQDLRVVG